MQENSEIVFNLRIDRKAALLMLFVVAVVSGGIAVSETLTIMTSYPVPSGIYTQLITTGGSASKPVNTIFNRTSGNTILVPSATCNDGAHCMVGIGTTSPATTLDVNGGIRPGAATTTSPCSSKGALGYDNISGAPVYCNGTAWTAPQSSGSPPYLQIVDCGNNGSCQVHQLLIYAVNGGTITGCTAKSPQFGSQRVGTVSGAICTLANNCNGGSVGDWEPITATMNGTVYTWP